MVTRLGGLDTAFNETWEVLHDTRGHITIDGTVPPSVRPIRKGDIVARRTSDNMVVAAMSTRLTVLAANATPTLVVADANAFAVGDVIQVQGEAGTHTVAAVNYDTNTITLTANLTADRAIGQTVIGTVAGTNVAIGINAQYYVNSHAYRQGIAISVRGNFIYSKIRGMNAEHHAALAGRILAGDIYAL